MEVGSRHRAIVATAVVDRFPTASTVRRKVVVVGAEQQAEARRLAALAEMVLAEVLVERGRVG